MLALLLSIRTKVVGGGVGSVSNALKLYCCIGNLKAMNDALLDALAPLR